MVIVSSHMDDVNEKWISSKNWNSVSDNNFIICCYKIVYSIWNDITEKRNLNQTLNFHWCHHLTSKFISASILNWWKCNWFDIISKLLASWNYHWHSSEQVVSSWNLKPVPQLSRFHGGDSVFFPKFTYITPWKLEHWPFVVSNNTGIHQHWYIQ